MLGRLVLRDLVLCALTAGAWWIDARTRASGGAGAVAIGLVTGALTGLLAYLLHEWGHLLASLATGSVVHYPRLGESPLSFHFDGARNDRRQFFWMSSGGYVASLLGLLLVLGLVPWHAWSGQLAIVVAALGTIATVAIELPITVRVARGGPVPTSFAYLPPRR
jgi:hypothetical protein